MLRQADGQLLPNPGPPVRRANPLADVYDVAHNMSRAYTAGARIVATFLLGQMRSEFLATPTLVRLYIDSDGMAALAVKAPALQLKYVIAHASIAVSLTPVEDDTCLAYAVDIPDDPEDPAFVWSVIESDGELDALRILLHDRSCKVHLFNEISINVASTVAEFDIDPTMENALADYISRLVPCEGGRASAPEVVSTLDALRLQPIVGSSDWLLRTRHDCTWEYSRAWYYSNGSRASYLSLLETNDGEQQEALCLWLTDAFAPQGAHLNPSVSAKKTAQARELCDLLLTSNGYTFIFESKALAVLSRPNLPTRSDLHADLVKHIAKATRQIAGAVRYLRKGYPVTDHRGDPVHFDRDKPLHLIILVPDLSLLSEADNLGKYYLAEQITKTGCYVHILDPTQLLRLVQGATMIMDHTSTIARIAALHRCLTERLERALELDTPYFDFLTRA